MMLTIKKRNERTNLHGTASANQVLGGGSGDTRNAQNNNWDVEGEVVNSGNTEGVAAQAAVVALSRSEGRGVKELHLTEEADWSGEGADGGLDGLAHITEDQISRSTRSGDGTGNGALEGSVRSGHVARWVVAHNVVGRGVKLVAIGSRGGGDDGGAVVRVRLGDLANETSNR
jgi:hypothetical protein